jgi:hypothetical protein
MTQSIIVWELQTVPDLHGFAAASDLVDKSHVEVHGAIFRDSGWADVAYMGPGFTPRAYRYDVHNSRSASGVA